MISIADIAFRAQQLRTFTYDSSRIYGVSLAIYFAMALVLLAMGRMAEYYAKPRYLRTWLLRRKVAQ
jgi:polar amino acid transport system permease protein